MADTTGDPQYDAWLGSGTSAALNQLLQRGIPRDVAEYMLSQPSYAEGERTHGEAQGTLPWSYHNPGAYGTPGSGQRAQDINYQPGGNSMAAAWGQGGGMPGMGGGAPGGAPGGLTPQQQQLLMQIMSGRAGFPGGGAAGMQPTSQLMRGSMGQPLAGAGSTAALQQQLSQAGPQIPPQILQLLLQQGTLGGQGGAPNISPQVAALLAHYFGGAGGQGPQAQPSPGPFPVQGGGGNLTAPT